VPDRVLFAITGHGYGHATRSLAIARLLRSFYPGTRITYSTSVPREFLDRSGAHLASAGGRGAQDAPAETLRPMGYEPGTAEASCFEVDVSATRALYRPFADEIEERIEADAKLLREGGYRGVISDIASIPIAAAARAGLPSIAISNFTWDWILDPLLQGDPALAGLPRVLASHYGRGDIYLRLPFHPPDHPFKKAVDLPLIGRSASLSREDALRRLGLPVDSRRPLVLVSIGGLKVGKWPRTLVQDSRGMDFVVVGDLPIDFSESRALFLPDDLGKLLGFADLVRAADVVLAKPGYGTCSECAANGTPMVGIERRGFAETPWLTGGLGRYVAYRDLSLEDFFAGRWEAPLSEVVRAGRSAPLAENGAEAAVRSIGEVLGLGAPSGA
jgi:hypothetical protein